MSINDMMWTDATRDFQAEEDIRSTALARHATIHMWNFTRTANSRDEFEQRYLIVENNILEHMTASQAQSSYAAMVEELTPKWAAVQQQSGTVEPALMWTTAGWQIMASPERNPNFDPWTPEQGPLTGNTGQYPQETAGADPQDPIDGQGVAGRGPAPVNVFPMEPTPWTPKPDAQWVEYPMDLRTQSNVGNPVEGNPHYFENGTQGLSSDPEDGFPVDPSGVEVPQDLLQRYQDAQPTVSSTAAAHVAVDDSAPQAAPSEGSAVTPPPPSMVQGGPGAEAAPTDTVSSGSNTPQMPGAAPAAPTVAPAKTGGIDPHVAAFFLQADQTRSRPSDFNPSGVADEYDERTWEGPASQHPRQDSSQRNVNTPQTSKDPIATMSSSDVQQRQEEEERQ